MSMTSARDPGGGLLLALVGDILNSLMVTDNHNAFVGKRNNV
jgi:hypothetical protein